MNEQKSQKYESNFFEHGIYYFIIRKNILFRNNQVGCQVEMLKIENIISIYEKINYSKG